MDRCEWEAGLDAALIGGREKTKIVIADYDPRWPMWRILTTRQS
jgi:hypothetical protein